MSNQCASCARWNLESTRFRRACDPRAFNIGHTTGYLNTYYVSMCAQVNYRIEELFVLLS